MQMSEDQDNLGTSFLRLVDKLDPMFSLLTYEERKVIKSLSEYDEILAACSQKFITTDSVRDIESLAKVVTDPSNRISKKSDYIIIVISLSVAMGVFLHAYFARNLPPGDMFMYGIYAVVCFCVYYFLAKKRWFNKPTTP